MTHLDPTNVYFLMSWMIVLISCCQRAEAAFQPHLIPTSALRQRGWYTSPSSDLLTIPTAYRSNYEDVIHQSRLNLSHQGLHSGIRCIPDGEHKKYTFRLQDSPLFRKRSRWTHQSSNNPTKRHSSPLCIKLSLHLALQYIAQSTPAIANPMKVAKIPGQPISHAIQTTCRNILNSISVCHFQTKEAIKWVTYSICILTFTYVLFDSIQTAKRQSMDPTSEWSTYAINPMKRGLALSFLLMRITPLLMSAYVLDKMPLAVQQISPLISPSRIRTKAGTMFSNGLLTLGPLYIKIGQILSCREDFLPHEFISAMEKLQDSVPAKSGQDALDLAYEAYDGGKDEFESIFSEFDDVPIAAASLGQVHRAVLRESLNGENQTVAIKLQRGRLREIYDRDLTLMQRCAKVVDTFGGSAGNVGGVRQSWEVIFKDAETILYREIDYRDEAKNSMQFAEGFGLGKNGTATSSTTKSLDGKVLPSAASWIRTPYVYESLSSERVLVMEYVPSIKISNDSALKDAGVTYEDRKYLAEMLARAYLRQFVSNKFFSTDPHPGNLGVECIRDETGKKTSARLVFYDFGQACYLKEDQAGGILDVIEGIMDVDVERCVNAFDRMGVLVDSADIEKVKSKVRDNFETGKVTVKRQNTKTPNLSTFRQHETAMIADSYPESNETLNDMEIMSYFTLPAEYAFVARALTQLDGVGKGLDSEFDFISAAAPYIVEIKGTERYIEEAAVKYLSNLVKDTLRWQSSLFKKAGFKSSR